MGKIEMNSKLLLIVIAGLIVSSYHTNIIFAEEKNPMVQIQWLETSYPASGTGIVRVIDPDMNLDPKAVDNFDVYVWSDSDPVGTDPTVSETGPSTGIFEGTVFFTTTDESSGHRLHIVQGGEIYVTYKDTTSSATIEETPSFGEISSIDGEFYSDDKRLIDPILAEGKEVQFKIQIWHENMASIDMRMFVVDNPPDVLVISEPYTIVETLDTQNITLEGEPSPKIFDVNYVPKETGNYAYVISVNDLDRDNVLESISHFSIVQEYSKTFEENNGCRDGFNGIIKPNYSTVVCVTEETGGVLLERGWHHPYVD